MNRKITVTNIQRFSLHDGPGIRTTVFLKGCSLQCPWCANPENIRIETEPCTDSNEPLCYGKEYSLKEIFDECIKDMPFYGNDGGVTFSGGEPLLNINKYEPLLRKFKEENISLCAETALFVKKENIETATRYFDFFCADIKILDEKKCRNILCGDLEIYKENISILLKSGKSVQFRVPLIVPYTTENENIMKIIDFCIINGIKSLELIKGHNLAEKKYKTLKRNMYIAPDISEAELDEIQNIFSDNGIKTNLCVM